MNQEEKWKIELFNTPLWLIQSMALMLVFCLLMVWLLRHTTFGQRFATITMPCIRRQDTFKLGALLIVLLLLVLLEVRMSVLNSFFYNGLYSALQNKAAEAFWFFALINALLAGVGIIHRVVNDYLEQVLMIRWLERLNKRLVDAWLSHKNYYRLYMRRHAPDNIDQRIQQDAQDFIASTVLMLREMLSALVSVVEFSILLWGLSGVLNLFGISIPRGMVVFIYGFILLATLLSVWIGHPLVRLNFHNERFNGNYRFALMRIREHAESIAFYHGEPTEKINLRQHFREIIHNRWLIVYRSLALNGFNAGITQISNLLPLMLQAPRFFAGQATLGDMHQTVQVFNRLQRALSFFRNAYEEFTAYQARLERLDGFLESMKTEIPYKQPEWLAHETRLSVADLSLYRNNGEPLFEGLAFSAEAGDAVLIKGKSGCGKTSLLRALAGLWPFGSSGHIERPQKGGVLFIPQRPYAPQGSLREAICYPNLQPSDAKLESALKRCALAHLIERLEIVDDWQNKLSPGELQRVAFVRLYLLRPRLLLLDEATSALDEETEATMYALVGEIMRDGMVVSIGHRSSLNAYHNQTVMIPAP